MLHGTCLCGGVSFKIDSALQHPPEACHCTQYRKQSSHYFAAVNVLRTTLTIQGEDKISWYHSSDQVRRGFCSTCGSTLFWDPLIDRYGYTAVAMGLFDSPTDMKLSKHTFVADKGDYYDIDDGLPQSRSY